MRRPAHGRPFQAVRAQLRLTASRARRACSTSTAWASCRIAASTPTFSSWAPVAERDGRECTDLPWPAGPAEQRAQQRGGESDLRAGRGLVTRLCQRAVHRQPDQQHVGWRAAVFLRARHADQHRLPRRDYRHRSPGRRQHRALVRQPRHRDQRRDVSAADHQHSPQPALHRQ